MNKYNLNSLRDLNLSAKYNFTPGDTARKLEKLKNQNNALNNPPVTNNRGMLNMGNNAYANPNPNPGASSPNLKSSSINNIINNDPLTDQIPVSVNNANPRQSGVNSGFTNMGSNNNYKVGASGFK